MRNTLYEKNVNLNSFMVIVNGYKKIYVNDFSVGREYNLKHLLNVIMSWSGIRKMLIFSPFFFLDPTGKFNLLM